MSQSTTDASFFRTLSMVLSSLFVLFILMIITARMIVY